MDKKIFNKAIANYTGGEYHAIRDAAKGLVGSYITEQDKQFAELFMAEVNTPKPIISAIRAITTTNIPQVGEEITFTLSSASKREDFAKAIAKDQVNGLGIHWNVAEPTPLQQLKTPILAYHFTTNRYMDIAEQSKFPEQEEIIFNGRYRVVNISKEIIDTEIVTGSKEVRLAPQQYAAKYDLTIREFVSKTGRSMLQIGDFNKPDSRTISKRKDVTIQDGFKKTTCKRTIYHVQLEEVAYAKNKAVR